ncbi:MAG: RsmB/NOP family class I SAM-dependent RNA methyltransferase [Fidelibacterota bacterium]
MRTELQEPPPSSNLPENFISRLTEIYPDHCASVFSSFHQAPKTSVWLNGLKSDPCETYDHLVSDELSLSPVAQFPHLYLIPEHQREDLTHHPFAENGFIYPINPSSMIPPLVLNPQPEDRVLDLTAAPGSKTLILAWLMKNQGRISAVENVKYRFHKLKSNLERTGVNNVRLFLKDGSTVWRSCPEFFDKVLLDSPCSTEGRFQADEPDTYKYWSERKIREMNRKQRKLLFSAVQSLKPGGELVYSTCTFAPEENEEPISRILQIFGGSLTVTKIDLSLENLHPGLTSWRKKNFHPSLADAVRIIPDGIFEGFFICRIRKSESTI